MASFRIVNGKYSVQIRKKSCSIYATFDDEKTAKLWAFYKEKAIDEIESFDIPLKELFTLEDMIQGKIEQLKQKGLTGGTIQDIEILKREFSEFLQIEIGKITYESLREKAQNMLNSLVRKGGHVKEGKGGVLRQQSPATVVRKLRCLGTVFSFAQEQNVKVENIANRLCNEIKKLDYQNKKIVETLP